MAKIVDIQPSETAETEIAPAESQPISTTPTTKPTKGKPGRPRTGHSPHPEQREAPFWDKVAKIPKEDWGTRAFLYVYCDEPVCVAKTWGDTRYMLKCSAPIDEEDLKQRYGSFKGWISLNVRKSGKDATDQIDRHQFEILDPLCPPKIPRAAWANDARNKRWEALLPPEPPSPTAAAANLTESINLYRGIVNEVKTELKENQPEPPAAAPSLLDTLKVAKEIFTPPAGNAPSLDPFDLASKIMAMRTNDPMIALLMQRMAAQDQALEASRDREFKLQTQLLENRNNPAAGNGKDFFTQLMEFGGDKIKGRIVDGLFGGTATETVTRAAKTSTLDFLRDLVPQILSSPVGNGLGALLSNLATRGAAMPANPAAMNGHAGPGVNPTLNGTEAPPETEAQRFARIQNNIATPMIIEFFEVWARTNDPGNSGDSFGMRVNDMWPEDFEFLQGIGAERLCSMIFAHHIAGPRLKPQEAKFRQFIKEFLAYSTGDQEPVPPSAMESTRSSSGIIDIEAEEGA